jgi:hypothetical protein
MAIGRSGNRTGDHLSLHALKSQVRNAARSHRVALPLSATLTRAIDWRQT